MQIPNPDVCDLLPASAPSTDVLKFLAERRSTLARCMGGPGPDAAQCDLILRLAARVPDHRKLSPWRFILFEGEARADFGAHLKTAFLEDCPNANAERAEFERTRFLRAPTIIAVISSPKDCPRGTPKWEQELSAGAVCMTMLLAARASGFAAQWLTEWYAFDTRIDAALGLTKAERVAGFIYIGTAAEPPTERKRPDMADITSFWQGG